MSVEPLEQVYIWTKSNPPMASPEFYSKNKFMIDDPKRGLKWLRTIGSDNIKYLTHLRLFFHACYPPETLDGFLGIEATGPSWCAFIDKLSSEASGLQDVWIYWDSEVEFGMHQGGGSDINVVRALGRLRGLRKMDINGYFAKEWPEYLERKLGIKVWDEVAHRDLQHLRKYQRRLKDMTP